jgi:FixJ family two-component response regulator
VLDGGVWIPPDVDLDTGSDTEAADLMARLASLTPQQVRVLMMLSEGLLNKQIAYELGVSEATVKARSNSGTRRKPQPADKPRRRITAHGHGETRTARHFRSIDL